MVSILNVWRCGSGEGAPSDLHERHFPRFALGSGKPQPSVCKPSQHFNLNSTSTSTFLTTILRHH